MKGKCKLVMSYDEPMYPMLETEKQRALIVGYIDSEYKHPVNITYGSDNNAAHFTNRYGNCDSSRIVPERMGQPL